MSQNPFIDAEARLSRAQEHISEFDNSMKTLLNQNLSSIVQQNSDGTGYLHKLKLNEGVSIRTRLLAADATNNLRAALDLLTAACARGGGATRSYATSFPFSEDEAGWNDVVARKCKNISKPVTDYWKSLRPYKGGDDLLHGLSKIRNANEHWAITNIIIQIFGLQAHFQDPSTSRMLAVLPFIVGDVEEVLLFASDNPAQNYGLSALLSIRFDGVDGHNNSDPTWIFRSLHDKISDIIHTTKSIMYHNGVVPHP